MRRLSPRTRTRYLVSPFFRRVLFVVAAAMRSATLFERPRAVSLRLMCSYWRLRFALLTPRGGIGCLLSLVRAISLGRPQALGMNDRLAAFLRESPQKLGQRKATRR